MKGNLIEVLASKTRTHDALASHPVAPSGGSMIVTLEDSMLRGEARKLVVENDIQK